MSGGKFKRGERLGAQSRTPEDKWVEKIQVQGGQTDSNDSPPNKIVTTTFCCKLKAEIAGV